MIKRRIESHAYCLAVIHLHIVNECSTKPKVIAVLNAHKRLVEENASAKDLWLFQLYVFITALELLVHRTTSDGVRLRNHLLPLQYLLPLIDTLCLEREHFMNMSVSCIFTLFIKFQLLLFLYSARLLHSLKANTFNAADSQLLEAFITQISSHKYRCEDALAGKQTDASLIQQPAGPCTIWQAEAFGTPTIDI